MKMNTILGALIGALVGAAGGATVGYLVSEKHFMKKLEVEIAKVQQSQVATQTPVAETEATEVTTEAKSEPDPQVENMASQYNTVSTENPIVNIPEEKDKVNYTAYSGPISSTDISKKVELKDVKPSTVRDPYKPYRISEEEFLNTCPEFEKSENLLYYITSRELIDDDTGDSIDIDERVGMENLLDLPTDGVIWVRNEAWGQDYRITFVDGAYSYTY